MLKHPSLKFARKDICMKTMYTAAVAVLAMVVVILPAYGATDSPNDATDSPNDAMTNQMQEYFSQIVQFFQNIISALVQAINNQLPAS